MDETMAEFCADTLDSYIETALWSCTDDEGNPLDDNYDETDVSREAYREMAGDVADFVETNWSDVRDLDPSLTGHNFWLTRNRHGAGFWDAGLGERGQRLTEMSHPYGECDLYVGDNGKLYI